MSEKPSFVRQCDICSHPARGEIDFLLAEKSRAEEMGGKADSLASITLRAIEIIDDKFPDAKRVSEASIRTHYKRHQLFPGSPNVSIDRDKGVVLCYGRALPLIRAQDQVDILNTIAFWNLVEKAELLGEGVFKATTAIRLKRKVADDELEQFAKEQLGAGTPDGAEGAFVPLDAKSSK